MKKIQYFIAIAADAPLPAITWYSDDAAVATVSPQGLVTAVGKGTCTITVETLETRASPPR